MVHAGDASPRVEPELLLLAIARQTVAGPKKHSDAKKLRNPTKRI